MDTCLEVFQNLDQGPVGALKNVFLKYGYYFGMDGPRGLEFFSIFFNMAIILERIDLEA